MIIMFFTIINLILDLIVSAILAMAFHEFGHYIIARYFNKHLEFNFEWGYLFNKPYLKIPRFTWKMPTDLAKEQKRDVALAGFILEALMCPLMNFAGFEVYVVVVFIHLALYKFYAGESSDFKYI